MCRSSSTSRSHLASGSSTATKPLRPSGARDRIPSILGRSASNSLTSLLDRSWPLAAGWVRYRQATAVLARSRRYPGLDEQQRRTSPEGSALRLRRWRAEALILGRS